LTTALRQAVSFECEGCQLYGTLRRPEGLVSSSDTGVVILNQGPLDRSGTHQISTKIVKRFNAFSIPTLQFDARGVGESEGDWATPVEGEPIHQLYRRIFEGAWKRDTAAAIEFLQSETGVKRILLVGLCGGASTALHVGALHPSVQGMAMVGMPVRVVEDSVDGRTDSYIRSEAARYFEKAFAPKAWKRFITFQTDYRTLRRLATRWLSDRLRGRAEDTTLVSRDIIESFHTAVHASRRMLFVYGENDYLWTEFRDLFLPSYSPERHGFDLKTIPAANHTLTEAEWQEQLYAALSNWALERGARAAR